ncbi:hypothetical protein C8A03DRAFT_34553 [Achaetomium macrosporum]|uniref:Uncharacterized protein n=1 Tax=Achaetomium macrosporum TaxID=79813 RepID=A0AAN7HBK1_9PEZI|nr:hypothetical protein C8A03DRAFT_34553 [Achaetomium macrosporum]
MNNSHPSIGDTPRSSTYIRAYNESYSRHYNQLYRPCTSLSLDERLRAQRDLASTCELLANADALMAEIDEDRKTRYAAETREGSWRSPSNPYAFDIPRATYPTSSAPSESDLRNQSYSRQQDYNRTHQNWRAEDTRQDWNRWMYGRP